MLLLFQVSIIYLLIHIIFFPVSTYVEVEVYHQERTVDKYLYQSGLPAMSEMTICFWANLGQDDDNRTDDWLVSIAREGLGFILSHLTVF